MRIILRKSALFLIAAALLSGIFFPASAANTRTAGKIWRITLTAQILKNDGDAVTVYLKSPQKMAIEKDDFTSNIQVLPITARTTAVDAKGAGIDIRSLLPGQKVKATFRYQIADMYNGMYDDDELMAAKPVECLQITVSGETIKRKSSIAGDKLGKNVCVGTILPEEFVGCAVFLEGGVAYPPDYKNAAWPLWGTFTCELTKNAVILDADGKRVKYDDIKPLSRAVITFSGYEYNDGASGGGDSSSCFSARDVIGLCYISKIQLIGNGEKIIE